MCLLESWHRSWNLTKVGISNLWKLRKSVNISQVTFKDLGFSITSSSQKKPSCSNVGPPPGGPSVGEGTWDFINCKAAKAEWENAGELKESKTTGSHQVSIRSPSIHHPSLYVIDQAILFGWKQVGQSDWGVVITSIFEDSLSDSFWKSWDVFGHVASGRDRLWQEIEKVMTCNYAAGLPTKIHQQNRLFTIFSLPSPSKIRVFSQCETRMLERNWCSFNTFFILEDSHFD